MGDTRHTRSKEIAAVRRAASTLGGVAIMLLALVALAASDSAIENTDAVVEESPKRDPNEMLYAMARELKQDAVPPASEVAQTLALEAVAEVDDKDHDLVFEKHKKKHKVAAAAEEEAMKGWSAQDVIHTPAWLVSAKAKPKPKKSTSGEPSVARVMQEARQTSKEAQEPLSVEKKAEIAARQAEHEAKVMAAAKATAKALAAAKTAVHSKPKSRQHASTLKGRTHSRSYRAGRDAVAAKRVTKEVLAAANIAASAERRAAQALRQASHSVLGGPVVYSTAAAKKRDMQDMVDDTELANSEAKENDEENTLVRAQIAQTREEIRLEEARGGVPEHDEDVDEVEFLEVFQDKNKKPAKKSWNAHKLSKKLQAAQKATASTKFRALKAKIADKAAIKKMQSHKDGRVTSNHADFLKAQVQQARQTLKQAHISENNAKVASEDSGVEKFIKSAKSVLKKPWQKPKVSKDGKNGPKMPKIDFDKIGIHEADLEVARQQAKIQNDAARAGAKAGLALAKKQLAQNPLEVKQAIAAKLARFKKPLASAFNSHRMAQRAADEAKDAARNVLARAAAKNKKKLQKQLSKEEAATMKPFRKRDIIKQARQTKIVRAVTPLATRTANAVMRDLERRDAESEAARVGEAKKASAGAHAHKTAVRKAVRMAMLARKNALAQHEVVRVAKRKKRPVKKLSVDMISMRVQQAIAAAAAKEHKVQKRPEVKKVNKAQQHRPKLQPSKRLKPQPKRMAQRHQEHHRKVQKVQKQKAPEGSTKAAVKAFLEGIGN